MVDQRVSSTTSDIGGAHFARDRAERRNHSRRGTREIAQNLCCSAAQHFVSNYSRDLQTSEFAARKAQGLGKNMR
eukprot:gene13172-biopygen15558